jgi:CRISPR-associated protein Csb2
MRVTEEAPEPNYIPQTAGSAVLRVPSAGRLEELRWLFEANRRPSAGALATYANIDGTVAEATILSTEFEQLIVLRKNSGPGLPIEAALTLTDAARTALMGAAGGAGLNSELLHGHNNGTHCAVIALPFVGRKHADGHLMGFGVVLPRNISATERRVVMRTCGLVSGRGLHIPGIGDWSLEPLDPLEGEFNLRPATWTQPRRIWGTVTPILLDRFPKKNGPSVNQILTSACERIGLPAPEEITHGPYSSLEGVPPVPTFKLQRKPDERPRWGVHATLRFAVPVRGPVLLGAGRYFGLGLLRPLEGEAS